MIIQCLTARNERAPVGVEEAAMTVFPEADHQLCVVHEVRDARTKLRRSDSAELLASLKTIYRADDQGEAERALSSFADTWKKRYPGLVRYWRENFSHLTVFLNYPEQLRPYIYTTRKLERINKEVKKRTKTIEAFSSEESLISALYFIFKFEDEKLRRGGLHGFSNSVTSGDLGLWTRIP